MKKQFEIFAGKYSEGHRFFVYYPASLDKPRDHAVMFINRANAGRVQSLAGVCNSIVFCQEELEIPEEVERNNLIIRNDDPRTAYCLFYRENNITNVPPKEIVDIVDGAYIAKTAVIGKDTTIMPLAYIGGEVIIGNHVYIGSGVKIVGKVQIGNNVVIRENSVIGADGLSTDRDQDGKAATMPQFGGVTIMDNVQIGALSVIARGAIDDTVIGEGAKIDNSTFISHNVKVGNDSFIVGESILFGGASTGEQAFISGNSTVRNKCRVGARAFVGMGSVVTKDVKDDSVVCGNPAHLISK